MYIGRTNPNTQENDVRGLVHEHTKTDSTDGIALLEVEVIAELKDHMGGVNSQGWRVTAPYTHKEELMKESSWPSGWTFHQYFPPRKEKSPVSLLKPGIKLA